MNCSAETRFFRKVSRPEDPNRCWEWRAGRSGEYGTFWFDGRMVPAHRFSYELANGPIPDGLEIDHRCEYKLCVNPAHLEAVTPRVNTLRGNGPAAIHDAKVECDHGHAFSPENTYWTRQGARVCRTCRRRSQDEFKARRKAAAASPSSQLALANSNPKRAALFDLLSGSPEPMMTKEIAIALGLTEQSASYQLRQLRDIGLAEVTGKRWDGRYECFLFAAVQQVAVPDSADVVRRLFGFDYWSEPTSSVEASV